MMRKNRKQPEGKILENIKNNKWHFGTVTHDGHALEAKGIKSPSKESAIAVAFIKKERREVWFTSEERIKKFKEDCMQPYEIKYLNEKAN